MLDSLKTRWTEWLEEHSTIETLISFVGDWLPPLNYITIHYGYFISVTMASSLIFWGSSTPFGSVNYVDSLFQVTSAITNTGLNTRNLDEFTTWQQVQLWFLLMIGSPIWVSFWTVLVRKHAFEKRFEGIVEAERERHKRQKEMRKRGGHFRRARNLLAMTSSNKVIHDPAFTHVPGLLLTGIDTEVPSNEAVSAPFMFKATVSTGEGVDANVSEKHIRTEKKQHKIGEDTGDHISFIEPIPRHSAGSFEGRTSAYQHGNHLAPVPSSGRRASDATSAASAESEDFLMHWKNFLGKHNISRSGQFYDLNSEERERLGGCEYRALKILAVTVPLYSALWQFLGAVALACWIATRNPDVPREYGVDPWWTGIFYSVSAFNNGGFALIKDSVIPFQAVRACGFVVISIPVLYIGVQVLYLIMMYISVYPVVITMRNSNVYEERSLGIYDDDDPATKEQERASNTFTSSQEPDKKPSLRKRNTGAVISKQLKRVTTFQGVGARRSNQNEEETSRASFIGQQIRGQLAHDLWWLVLAILIIVVIETDHFLGDPVTYSVFNIIFESVSAYACVGLSIGLPNDAYSFSGGLHKGSKLVMCLVMMRGRHRGLPVAIDRAVRLPGEQLQKDEVEDARIRRTKTIHRMVSRDV
ncbi:hypothetical protein ACO1O0_003410 [Amphichorda felina]